MPELPEVETARRGIQPHITAASVTRVVIRQSRLRWPIPARLKTLLPGQHIDAVTRRGKYLLLKTDAGSIIIHLGMSGSLRIVDAALAPEKHDHIDIVFATGMALRLRDPRRFGAVLWTNSDPAQHKLLKSLGPEPLEASFTADYLFGRSRGKSVNIKTFIMNSSTVVGVGNIYASEALYLAGINPHTAAGRISLARYTLLVDAIKNVLQQAIDSGGTTLRDFTDGAGRPGYFRQQLNVYGRTGEPCPQCGTAIKSFRQNQRATFYCPQCQH